MTGLALVVMRTVGLAIAAVLSMAPLAALSGWHAASPGRAARASHGCLRVLAALPLVVVGLVLLALLPSAAAWWLVLLTLALGAYAPLALAVSDARESLGRRLERDALALGATPRTVFYDVMVPVLRPALLGASLRTIARLTGETGVFLIVSSTHTSTLGARLLTEANRAHAVPVVTLLVLLGVPVALAAIAARLEARA